MTVAAVILAASTELALADTDGQPRVRRLVDAAWAGGAVPVIVVAPDPSGSVAAALAGAPATLAPPAPMEGGPVAQIAHGIDAARAEMAGTDAALIWPASLAWVDPETVTSLIEAHGMDRETLLRPAFRGQAGWPALLPGVYLEAFRALPPDATPSDLLAAAVAGGMPSRDLELGDPGTTIDATTQRADLPPFEGPSQPAGGHVHEWGASVAQASDDVANAPEEPG